MAGVTARQKAKLRELGYSDREIRGMSQATADKKINGGDWESAGRKVVRTQRPGGGLMAPPDDIAPKGPSASFAEPIKADATSVKMDDSRIPTKRSGTATGSFVEPLVGDAKSKGDLKAERNAAKLAEFITGTSGSSSTPVEGKRDPKAAAELVDSLVSKLEKPTEAAKADGKISEFIKGTSTQATDAPGSKGGRSSLASGASAFNRAAAPVAGLGAAMLMDVVAEKIVDRMMDVQSQRNMEAARANPPKVREDGTIIAPPISGLPDEEDPSKNADAAKRYLENYGKDTSEKPKPLYPGAEPLSLGDKLAGWLLDVRDAQHSIGDPSRGHTPTPPAEGGSSASPEAPTAASEPAPTAPLPGRKPEAPAASEGGLMAPRPAQKPAAPAQTPVEDNRVADQSKLGDMLALMKANGVQGFNWGDKAFRADPQSPSGYVLIDDKAEQQGGPVGPGTGTLY